jgi:hypothetical protein
MKTTIILGLATSLTGILAPGSNVFAASNNIFRMEATKLKPLVAKMAYKSNPMIQDESVLFSGRSTSGVSDFVGTMSVQDFGGQQSTLANTHASADGFRNYLTTWYKPNFAMRDASVSAWLYNDIAGGDNYDLWSYAGTDYGIDAVRTAFHSGHGGMAATNIFFAPLGANWANRGWNAFSDQMALGGNNWSFGDERLRYLFWDTCNSVVVNGGSDPYSTWGTRARGIRMVFGYTTVSIDNPNYGKFFWEEWNKGKTLSQAFLDASWRINTGQSPSVVAFGADQSSASDILYNERFMTSSSSGNNWGQWRWYNARSSAVSPRTDALSNFEPSKLGEVFTIAKGNNRAREVSRIAHAFGINVKRSSEIQNRPFNLKVVETKAGTLAVEPNGNFELRLNTPANSGIQGHNISDDEVLNKASSLAQQLNFAKGLDLHPGLIRDTMENNGSKTNIDKASIVEKTVVLDQMVGDVPFIDTDAGHLEISFDAQFGNIKQIRGNLQKLQPATRAFRGVQGSQLSLDDARQAALNLYSNQGGNLRSAENLQIAPNSESIGYQVIDGKAVPVYRAQINDASQTTARPRLAIVPLIKE